MANTFLTKPTLRGYCRNKDGGLSCWERGEDEALNKHNVNEFLDELTDAIKSDDHYILPGLALIQGGKA